MSDAISLSDEHLSTVIELLDLADSCHPSDEERSQQASLRTSVGYEMLKRQAHDACLGLIARHERALALLDAVTSVGGVLSFNGGILSATDQATWVRVQAWLRLRNELKREPTFVPGVRARIETLEAQLAGLRARASGSVSAEILDEAVARMQVQLSQAHQTLDRLGVTPHPDLNQRLAMPFATMSLARFTDVTFNDPGALSVLSLALADWLRRSPTPIVLGYQGDTALALASQVSCRLLLTFGIHAPLIHRNDPACGDPCRGCEGDPPCARAVLLMRSFTPGGFHERDLLGNLGRHDAGLPLLLALKGTPHVSITERAECRLISELK